MIAPREGFTFSGPPRRPGPPRPLPPGCPCWLSSFGRLVWIWAERRRQLGPVR